MFRRNLCRCSGRTGSRQAIVAWEPSTGGYKAGLADALKLGEIFVDEWGVKREANGEMSAYPLSEDVPIKSESDLANFKFPDPLLEHRYEELREYLKRFRGEKLVAYCFTDMFELTKYVLGFEEFLLALLDRSPLVRKTLEMTTDWVIEIANNAIDIGADMIICASDIAIATGPWVHPETINELFIPCLRRVTEAVKKRRAYMFYHSHGNVWSMLDELVNTGIDVLNPLAVEGMMDIGVVKKIYGKKIVVGGNISTDVLTRGSRDDVVRLVKKTIESTGAGGHILMSSSSVYSGVNPDNYRAMVETARKYGQYSK